MEPSKLSLKVSLTVIEARENRGWSQTVAAKQLGITRNSLILIENAERLPSFPVTVKLSHVLGIDINEFYDYVVQEDQQRNDAKGEADLVSVPPL